MAVVAHLGFNQERWNEMLRDCVPDMPIDWRRHNKTRMGDLYRSQGYQTIHQLRLCWRPEHASTSEHADGDTSCAAPLEINGTTISMVGDSMMQALASVASCVANSRGLSTKFVHQWPPQHVAEWPALARTWSHAALVLVNFGVREKIDALNPCMPVLYS